MYQQQNQHQHMPSDHIIDYNEQPQLIYDKFGDVNTPEEIPEAEGFSYEDTEGEQYDTNDYENLINITYQKAKKYKRKARKLYTSLQHQRQKNQDQADIIKQLEAENAELSSKMMLFSNRVDDLQHAYNKLYEVITTFYFINHISPYCHEITMS